MEIIKNGRIRIWNAVKKQFEVVHPETEVARITDFADGIVQKLALTSAMTAVTALQSDSWFGKLLKMALTASGVKYSIAQNGYVCLGELFGGLIIQWGKSSYTNDETITLPVAYSKFFVPMTSIVQGTGLRPQDSFGIQALSLKSIRIMSKGTNGGIAWYYTIGC